MKLFITFQSIRYVQMVQYYVCKLVLYGKIKNYESSKKNCKTCIRLGGERREEEYEMNNSIKNMVDRLYENVLKGNFIEIAYEITDELIKSENSFEAIEPIIKLIELNPDVDFGNPGPLVHFLEKFDEKKYDDKLVESIRRNPTTQTIFMLKRIINSIEGSKKKDYLDLFDFVVHSSNSSNNAKNSAQQFKAFHTNDEIDDGNTLLELRNIVLAKPLDGQKDLIKIKNVLGLELPIKDLLIGSRKLPYILMKDIPNGRARRMVEQLGSLAEKLELKPND